MTIYKPETPTAINVRRHDHTVPLYRATNQQLSPTTRVHTKNELRKLILFIY